MLKLTTVTSFQYPVTKSRGLNSLSIIYHNFVSKTLLLTLFLCKGVTLALLLTVEATPNLL